MIVVRLRGGKDINIDINKNDKYRCLGHVLKNNFEFIFEICSIKTQLI